MSQEDKQKKFLEKFFGDKPVPEGGDKPVCVKNMLANTVAA